MKKDLVSVVITTFKRDEAFLSRAIESVLNQSYENLEVLVIDDNGTDSKYAEVVRNVVSKYESDSRIKLFCHETNKGAQKARNTGIKESVGNYIAFLDDDDQWLCDKLEKQIHVFLTNNDCDNLGMVYCWFNKVKVIDNKFVKKKVIRPKSSKKNVHKKLLINNFIGSNSFPLIKKECFDKVGCFDEKLKAKQDYDMWMRICEHYRVDYVNKPLCNYYDHNEIRITNNFKKKLSAEIMFLNKHFKSIKNNRRAYCIKNRIIGFYYFKLNDCKNAKLHLLNSIKIYPFDYKSYALLLLCLINEFKRVRNLIL